MAKYIPTPVIDNADLELPNLQPGQWVDLGNGNKSRYLGTSWSGVHDLIHVSVTADRLRGRVQSARNKRRDLDNAVYKVRRALLNGVIAVEDLS